MKYEATAVFWKKFYKLSSGQKESVRRTWLIFKTDPFDRRLGTHRIHNLSAQYKRTIYSVVIEADLRAVFCVEGDTITTLDVGTHSIYK